MRPWHKGVIVAALAIAIGWLVTRELSLLVIGLAALLGAAAMLFTRSRREEQQATESPSPDETLW